MTSSRWTDAETESGDRGLPDGSCNLYTFPNIRTPENPRGVEPTATGLRILKRLLLELAASTPALTLPDQVGAFAIHALMVCNTEASLELAMELIEAQPHMLTQVHVNHRSGEPVFTGESCLHIAAVNKREAIFVSMVELAAKKLPRDELQKLLSSQAQGSFFTSIPMLYYGGTALSYACVFGLRQGVLALLMTNAVSLNSRADACPNTGFLPLHAIVANGVLTMFDFVTKELPNELRADDTQHTRRGKVAQGLRSLTAMQLAAKLGDHQSFRSLLRKQCEILWVWGPVTQFQLDLKNIDSAGKGGGDIMELITRMDATKRTTQMLLDTFMNGFIHRLFEQKWRVLDATLVVMVMALGFWLKYRPEATDGVRVFCGCMLGLMALILEEEVRTAYLFVVNEQGEDDARLTGFQMLKQAAIFMRMHAVHIWVLGMMLATLACVLVLSIELPLPSLAATLHPDGNVTVHRRSLRGGGGAEGGSDGGDGDSSVIYDEGFMALLWILLGSAQAALLCHFAFAAFMPFEQLNILMISIVAILRKDIKIFLIIYTWIMIGFLACLYVLYPRSGSHGLDLGSPFNSPLQSVQAVFELSFLGEPAEINLAQLAVISEHTSWPMFICALLWLFLYLLFIIVTLILLLNLLIAMLTHTFDEVREEATLQSRLSFAQCLVKHELVAATLGMRRFVGDQMPNGSFVYRFRSLLRAADEDSDDGYGGNFDDGTTADPFLDPTPQGIARVQATLSSLQAVADYNQKLLVSAQPAFAKQTLDLEHQTLAKKK
jgi:hypothetical protein